MTATPGEIAQQIEALVARVATDDGPGIGVHVTLGGETLHRAARGLASLELSVPLTPDRIMRAGSITKQFTAVAVGILVDRGLVALDTPLCDVLSDLPASWQAIHLEHLLTHTSGLPDRRHQQNVFWQGTREVEPRALVDAVAMQPLLFAPGSGFTYTNAAYFALGCTIEALSGRTYSDFLRQEIFDPLAMTRTRVESASEVVAGRANGYARGRQGWEPCRPIHPSQAFSAGGLLSCLDDLAAWNAAIGSSPILRASTWERALQPARLASGASTRYGFGWFLPGEPEPRKIEHGGGIPGFQSHALRIPELDAQVVVLRNAEGVGASALALQIEALLRGEPVEAPAAPLAVSPDALDDYVGTYRFGPGDGLRIERDGADLFQVSVRGRFRLQRTGRDELRVSSFPSVPIRLIRNTEGSVVGLYDEGHLGPGRAEKQEQDASSAPRRATSIGPDAGSQVTLRAVTAENFRAILALRVAPAQERLVASNAQSIAEAHFHPEAWLRAIYAGETPVGFLMLHDENLRPEPRQDDLYLLWRLMIDARFQRCGFGARSISLLVEHVRTRPNADTLLTSCHRGEGSPKAFYLRQGFRATGRDVHGEMELALRLEPGAA